MTRSGPLFCQPLDRLVLCLRVRVHRSVVDPERHLQDERCLHRLCLTRRSPSPPPTRARRPRPPASGSSTATPRACTALPTGPEPRHRIPRGQAPAGVHHPLCSPPAVDNRARPRSESIRLAPGCGCGASRGDVARRARGADARGMWGCRGGSPSASRRGVRTRGGVWTGDVQDGLVSPGQSSWPTDKLPSVMTIGVRTGLCAECQCLSAGFRDMLGFIPTYSGIVASGEGGDGCHEDTTMCLAPAGFLE